jgi:hypothetical protein
MKKVLFPILALVLAISLALPVVAHTEASPYIVDLIADGGSSATAIDVGDVSVWNDAGELHVKYETTGGWVMSATHLEIAMNEMDIPQNRKGNPKVGQFSRSQPHDPPVTEWEEVFDLEDEGWPPCTDLYIAAQAEVVKETTTELVTNGGFETPLVSDTTTSGWQIYDSGTAGLGWAVAWAGSYANAPAPAHLELMNGSGETAGWTAHTGSQWAELDTDWDGPGGGLNNEPASVEISQTLAACPSGLYTLRYAWSPRPNHSDNALEVCWGGSLIDSPSGPNGSNTDWTLEEHEYLSGPSSGTVDLAFRETGTADSLGMFLDSVSVVCVRKETAWGDGDRFVDRGNWATYFTYHVQGPVGEAGDGWTDVSSDYAWEARARHGGTGWRAFVDDVFPPVNPLWTGGTVPWLNGGGMWFELIYDDSFHDATFTIYDSSDDSVLGTVTDSGLPGFDGLIGIQGKTSPEAAGSVVVDNVKVNGVGLYGDDGFTAQGTAGGRDLKYLDISGVLPGSFTLTGNLTFTWGTNPQDEGPCLSIYVQYNP